MKMSGFSVAPLGALVLTALLGGCAKSASAPVAATPPTLVELAPVVYADNAVPIRATGVLSRKTEADLSFKIGGVLEAVAVRVGDAVEKGQVLAQLRLDEIDAQLAQARSALEKAQRDLARVEKLQANAVATLENLQDARTAVEVASAQVRIAEFNRRYAAIAAPAAGRILRRTAEPNELVSAGKAILGFAADGDGWLVRVGLADADLVRVRVGDRAEIALGSEAAKIAGTITQIAEGADAVTRTTQIEVTLERAPAEARSGFVGAAMLFPQPVKARPRVPASVLVEGTHRSASLYLVEPGATVAHRVIVEVEALDGTDAYLRTALPTTAQLVVRGAEYLHDGASIAVAKN